MKGTDLTQLTHGVGQVGLKISFPTIYCFFFLIHIFFHFRKHIKYNSIQNKIIHSTYKVLPSRGFFDNWEPIKQCNIYNIVPIFSFTPIIIGGLHVLNQLSDGKTSDKGLSINKYFMAAAHKLCLAPPHIIFLSPCYSSGLGTTDRKK